MNGTSRMGDRSISIDLLNSCKFMAMRDIMGLIESSTPQFQQTLMNINREHLAMSNDIFNYMSRKGWYPVLRADHQTAGKFLGMYQPATAYKAQAAETSYQYQQPYGSPQQPFGSPQ